jgi:acyl dehydratase
MMTDSSETSSGPVIEQRGLYFEEFVVGATYRHRPGRTLTEADNVLFSTLTMNGQSLHVDAAWSATGPFGERLVNSMLTLSTLVGLSVASFQKRFTSVVMVNLLTDRIGSQLQTSSDVKIRGLIVGEVRSIETTGKGATLRLALKPEMVDLIPANVSARLLPKTLFGERFVDLVAPTGASGRHIAKGDTIGQDRTSVAIELERVFEDLLPLLRTVPLNAPSPGFMSTFSSTGLPSSLVEMTKACVL